MRRFAGRAYPYPSNSKRSKEFRTLGKGAKGSLASDFGFGAVYVRRTRWGAPLPMPEKEEGKGELVAILATASDQF